MGSSFRRGAVGTAALLSSLLALAGCSASPSGPGGGCDPASCASGVCDGDRCAPEADGGSDGATDSGALDTGSRTDTGTLDSGTPTDSGSSMDSAAGDGATDSAAGDSGAMDTGTGLSDDSDGDGITDFQEGRFAPGGSADTDGDGTPDYMDLDSDGDGIDDSVEAGDMSLSSPPVDSDFDGTPDFRDLDSDDNGVPDAVEGAGDADGDGRLDYRDTDNDGDIIDDVEEIGADPSAPANGDGDALPDYFDLDSDDDTISDEFEALVDTDGDGTPDRRDLDSDGDGYTDAEEAGDADLATPPVDTDSDGTPDFRDPDSDGDGLSDATERGLGTSRTLADTDGDGVSDLVEVGAGTDPLDGSVSPRTRGDFVFVVPYMAPPDPTRDTLQFSTTLQKADVYFLVDTTGSMGGEIANLRTSLSGTIIPMVRGRITDAWFGVGGYEDYPVSPYGDDGCVFFFGCTDPDRPFYQEQTMTTTASSAQAAVGRLATRNGNDIPEALIPALWSLSTRGILSSGPTPPGCPAGYRGFGCFRPDAVPVIVIVTDAPSHNYPGETSYSGISPTPPTYAQAITGLTDLGARVVGVNSGSARAMLLDMATRTGTVDAGGSPAPFVFDIASDGSGLGTAVVDAIFNAAQVPIEVSAKATDVVEPGETVDAVAAFLDHLETRSTAAPGLSCTTGLSSYDRPAIDGDAFPDTFRAVLPGTPVCFDIIPKMNATIMPTLMPQLFKAQIDVIGDGFTPLDSRIVFFLVPPRIPAPNE